MFETKFSLVFLYNKSIKRKIFLKLKQNYIILIFSQNVITHNNKRFDKYNEKYYNYKL